MRSRILASYACALFFVFLALPAHAMGPEEEAIPFNSPRALAMGPGAKAQPAKAAKGPSIGITSVSATAKMPWDEYDKQVQASGVIGALGPDLFGDQIEFYKNTLSFSVTDISLPGNFALPVALTRKMTVSDRYAYNLAQVGHDMPLEDWDLDIPNISGVYAPTWPDTRCSSYQRPAAPPFTGYSTQDFWNGLNASMPSGGELLVPNQGAPQPASGGPYKWMTPEYTYFTCLPAGSVANDTTGLGEGFLAITPDGTKYTFNWMAQNHQPDLKQPSKLSDPDNIGSTPSYPPLHRKLNALYVTKVEDRFGNTVTYTYDNAAGSPVRLRSIQASDGRLITLTYNGTALASATAHGRTWTYQYTSDSLSAVILPDASRWTYDFGGLTNAVIEPDISPDAYRSCAANAVWTGGGGIGRVTHPSGAVGEFEVAPARHGRRNIPWLCDNWELEANNPRNDVAVVPRHFDVLSIARKKISGPNLVPQEWTFSGGSVASWAPTTRPYPACQANELNTCMDPVCVDDSCAGNGHKTSVTSSTGEWQEYTFGNSYKYNEGKLLKIRRGTGTTELESEIYTYNLKTSGGPFAAKVGSSQQLRAAGWASEAIRPQEDKLVVRDGVSFNSSVNLFDAFWRPTSVDRYSVLLSTGADLYRKTETTTLRDNLGTWVLGQVEESHTIANGVDHTVSKTDFTVEDLPWKLWSFWRPNDPTLKPTQTLAYRRDASGRIIDGTLASVTDANNGVTQVANWKRGVPQLMTLADGSTVSAVVNDSGWITQVTDELGTATTYGYDAMGRLALTDYTDLDSVAWNSTIRTFAKMALAEFGVAAGNWKHTVSTGNGRTTTYYNPRWQPILVVTEDVANAATRSYVVTEYDAEGRESFKSYPTATAPDLTLPSSLPGIRKTYDALGRIWQVTQTSELGPLTTTTTYSVPFRTTVTNPRDYATTTEFQAYDTPSTEAPVKITAPETQTTTIVRDAFLKPLTIKRSGTFAGAAVNATRYYVYDADQRLCKTVEPETGSTFTGYDFVGNVTWSASGQPFTGTTCNRGTVLATAKTTRTYDPLNRLRTVDVPGSDDDLTYDYFADGALKSLVNGNGAPTATNARWDYTYNLRRMPVDETLTYGGLVRTLKHEYNINGHEFRLNYPSGLVFNTVPNALGQATIAASFASAVNYYANGGMSGFTYGNGIVHSMAQNLRNLPSRSLDQKPGQGSVLDDNYTYDKNGNVASITDTSALGGGTRNQITYDALDRLTYVNAPNQSWTSTTTYDALDNIRYNKVGSTEWTYNYDATNRLDMLTRTGATQDVNHDVRGNITSNGTATYVFDEANRMKSVTGKETYAYDGHGRRVGITRTSDGVKSFPMYSLAGKLVADVDMRDPLEQVREYYYLNGSQVARRYRTNVAGSAWTTRYIHTDSLGSGVVETKPDTTVSFATKYKPYGEPSTYKQGPGYTGHVTDAATGLSYMQQRYYDPQIGRFLSRDPVTANASTGANFNRYWYANNNPYNFTDPDGRMANSCSRAGGASCGGSYAGMTGSFALIMVGDPGKGIHNASRGFDRAAQTAKNMVENAGGQATIARVSTIDDIKSAMGKGPTISAAYYFGHSSNAALYPGEAAGSRTNVDYSNVRELSSGRLSAKAHVYLFSCYAGMGSNNIAQQIAISINRNVYAFSSGMHFTNERGLIGAPPYKKWDEELPVYMRPDNGMPPTRFTPQ
jgi:RHS repeat-associated protein